MHPVIHHLSLRRGKSHPFSDGHKIALVLWGGIMRVARGLGALIALEQLGLNQAFDSIYTVSAGFPLASYFLANQTRVGAALFYEECTNVKFLNRWRFWQGMDVPYLIAAMRERKPLNLERVLTSATRLYARVVNVKTRQLEYLETHEVGSKEFWQLMRAAVSVPILYRHPAQIGGQYYIDTNLNGRLREHMDYVLSTDHTDILVVYNAPIQRQKIKPADLARVCEFCPGGDLRLSRFELNPKILKQAERQMTEMVLAAFGQSNNIKQI
jgi:predicted patatin/cPLA2 family phospholipase